MTCDLPPHVQQCSKLFPARKLTSSIGVSRYLTIMHSYGIALGANRKKKKTKSISLHCLVVI